MFLSRVGTRVNQAKVVPAMTSAIKRQGFAPAAAASPLFFTEFKDNAPLSETLLFWPGKAFEEQFQKNFEPNVDIALFAVSTVLAYRLFLHFGITLNNFVREQQLSYAVRWQPGHHIQGPWEAVSHPLVTKAKKN